MSIEKAREMLQTFVSGGDVSDEFVDMLGVYFEETFGEQFEIIQELVNAAACYEKNGGEFLYSENDFRQICVRVLSFFDRIQPERPDRTVD